MINHETKAVVFGALKDDAMIPFIEDIAKKEDDKGNTIVHIISLGDFINKDTSLERLKAHYTRINPRYNSDFIWTFVRGKEEADLVSLDNDAARQSPTVKLLIKSSAISKPDFMIKQPVASYTPHCNGQAIQEWRDTLEEHCVLKKRLGKFIFTHLGYNNDKEFDKQDMTDVIYSSRFTVPKGDVLVRTSKHESANDALVNILPNQVVVLDITKGTVEKSYTYAKSA